MLTTWKKIILIFGLIFVACNTSTAADKSAQKTQNRAAAPWEYKIIAPNFLADYQIWLANELNRLAREEGWEVFATSPGTTSGNGDILIFLRRPLRE